MEKAGLSFSWMSDVENKNQSERFVTASPYFLGAAVFHH